MNSYGSIREEYVAAPSSACSCAPGGAAGQTGAGAGLAGGCRGPRRGWGAAGEQIVGDGFRIMKQESSHVVL